MLGREAAGRWHAPGFPVIVRKMGVFSDLKPPRD